MPYFVHRDAGPRLDQRSIRLLTPGAPAIGWVHDVLGRTTVGTRAGVGKNVKRLAVAAATGAIFVVSYLLEWHVVAPARQEAAATFQTELPIWLGALGWLLMAGLLVGLAWLLFVWGAGDRVAAGVVAFIELAGDRKA